ncbi:hypothetical protein [Aureimonas phyllosphaerae]|uniref:Uncharacterized protein n=1 Tax=Aureimonas phyllosphaerae TaxID=1166078 RepID=A0A7W6FTR8_9HYPH|nr:hypothetical protein [Aureimonas phyllosphaerae]MBB3934277.1 hypothetical protein [Aureimonas phyllosphaerae]MBB3958507.1 hypothetical protein [Aureimonas phyllosphaerae]SFE98112.1 hypothetical protein SAMN05216566_101483 [Aureimonas phyllosphaerae]
MSAVRRHSAAADLTMNLYRAGLSFCRTDLEDAFRALVGWPGEARLPNLNADQRQGLLIGVCRGLLAMENDRIMPSGTFTVILDEAGAERLAGATYAHGARAVLDTPAFLVNLTREQL